MSRPQVLVSNDDGISAPGIVALVRALAKADICDIHVSAPHTEQSAKSQALTLTQSLVVEESSAFPEAKTCFAVRGTPADSVMVAQATSFFPGTLRVQVQDFDLVVSGINRGDNMGLHVLYSGTVGAAREAACKGAPAIAFSLDNYRARDPAEFADAAGYAVHVVRAALGHAAGFPALPAALRGNVINVNIPFTGAGPARGYYLAHMSSACVMAKFVEAEDREAALAQHGLSGAARVHVLTNRGATFQKDDREGGDYWAVGHGWVSVCPLGLMQDYALYQEHLIRGRDFVTAVQGIVQGAAQLAGLEHGGVPAQLPRL